MSRFITIKAGFQALEVRPQGPAKAGLVLIQEIFGVNANISELAQHYASQGYHVVAPDLFWREEPLINLDPGAEADRTRAMALNAAFDDELGLSDLAACTQCLRSMLAPHKPIFAVGYCMGGRLSFRLGSHNRVDASVSYYGVNIDQYLVNADTGSPRLIHIAEKDALCPPEKQTVIVDWAKNAEAAVHIYEGATHAFARAHAQSYMEAAAILANRRTLEFFEKCTAALNAEHGESE